MGLGLILSAFLVWVPPRRSPAPTQLSYLCVCTITCTLSCGGRQSLWKVSVGVFGVPVGRPSVKTTRDLHGVPPLRKNSCSLGDGLDGSLSALVCGQPKGILFVFFACALPPPLLSLLLSFFPLAVSAGSLHSMFGNLEICALSSGSNLRGAASLGQRGLGCVVQP